MSNCTVAIVSPGSMGAAIGARLHANGVRVITPTGRSETSEARARSAGIEIVPEEDLGEADFIFSIVPPSEAVRSATRIAPLIGTNSKRPLFIDWNAIQPRRAMDIASIIESKGGRVADGGIIGLAPGPDGPGPLLYASGPEAVALSAIENRGVRFKVLQGPVGAASSLKMAYAGITKGMIALGAAMILAAHRAGCADALIAELKSSQSNLLAGYQRSIPDMFGKAERWVPELMEIAGFVGNGRSEAAIYDGIANFYSDLAKDNKENRKEVGILQKVLTI